MNEKPQKEHQWLDKLLGEWTYEGECGPGPDHGVMKSSGTESVRSLGGLWAICEGRGGMPGGEIGLTIMTLGFDPVRKRYTGTFIGSMMTYLWLYDGELDAAGTTLTLDAEGPDFVQPGKTAKYKDVIQFLDDDTRTLSSSTPGPDGTWHTFMTSTYKRKK